MSIQTKVVLLTVLALSGCTTESVDLQAPCYTSLRAAALIIEKRVSSDWSGEERERAVLECYDTLDTLLRSGKNIKIDDVEAMLGKPDVVGEYEKGYVYTSKGGWRNMLMFRFRGGRIQNVFLGPFIE